MSHNWGPPRSGGGGRKSLSTPVSLARDVDASDVACEVWLPEVVGTDVVTGSSVSVADGPVEVLWVSVGDPLPGPQATTSSIAEAPR